jgi:hypothetical protein
MTIFTTLTTFFRRLVKTLAAPPVPISEQQAISFTSVRKPEIFQIKRGKIKISLPTAKAPARLGFPFAQIALNASTK